VCIPLGCACQGLTNTWSCLENCGGGECVDVPCPAGCEAQIDGACGDGAITWVCTSSFDPMEFLDGGCDDLGSQVPRYCCPPSFRSECL
jgi:hypothetical protein